MRVKRRPTGSCLELPPRFLGMPLATYMFERPIGAASNQSKEMSMGKPGKVQGEGDYESAKRYDDAQKNFAKSGKVEKAARDAEPRSESEKREMEQAESAGRRRAKEEDPNVKRGPGGKAR